jgi:hypothetical protein
MNRKLDAFFLCAWLASCAPEEPNPRYDARVGQAEAGGLDAGSPGQPLRLGRQVCRQEPS